MREVKEGQIYRHFKGNTVKIIAIAKDSETLEDMEPLDIEQYIYGLFADFFDED